MFIGVYGGYQFGAQGSDLSAQEDLGYTTPFPNRVPATASDIDLSDGASFGGRIGYYFQSMPGFGIEVDGQYSRPNFERQNVTIRLTDTTIAGFDTFVMDQLGADFHMVMGGVNLLYRFENLGLGGIMPYVGAGPALYGVFIRGSGDSGNVIAPAAIATNAFNDGGEMASGGWGIGFNLKAGLEVPLGDHVSLDTEYKFSYAQMEIDNFRSLSDIEVTYRAHTVAAGLRYRF